MESKFWEILDNNGFGEFVICLETGGLSSVWSLEFDEILSLSGIRKVFKTYFTYFLFLKFLWSLESKVILKTYFY